MSETLDLEHHVLDVPPAAGRVLGTLIENGGGEHLLIPEEELRRVDGMAVATEDEARQRLEEIARTGQPRPSIRALAADWAWSKSKVERFLSRLGPAAAKPGHSGTMPVSTAPGSELVPHQSPTSAGREDGEDDDREQTKGEEHDYFGPDSPDLVIEPQPAIAIYYNGYGSIVIRQEARDSYRDEDQFVFVTPANLPRLIEALQKLL